MGVVVAAARPSAARLVGTDADTVFAAAHQLLTDPDAYAAMAKPMERPESGLTPVEGSNCSAGRQKRFK